MICYPPWLLTCRSVGSGQAGSGENERGSSCSGTSAAHRCSSTSRWDQEINHFGIVMFVITSHLFYRARFHSLGSVSRQRMWCVIQAGWTAYMATIPCFSKRRKLILCLPPVILVILFICLMLTVIIFLQLCVSFRVQVCSSIFSSMFLRLGCGSVFLLIERIEMWFWNSRSKLILVTAS